MSAPFADRFYRQSNDAAEAKSGDRLRIEDDWSHIYWHDPVEGCWVAYRRADCVGEEELPATRLPGENGADRDD